MPKDGDTDVNVDAVNDLRDLQRWLKQQMEDLRCSLSKEIQEQNRVLSEDMAVHFREHRALVSKPTLKLSASKTANLEPSTSTRALPKVVAEPKAQEASALPLAGAKKLITAESSQLSHAVASYVGKDPGAKWKAQHAAWYHRLDIFVGVTVSAQIINMLVEMEWESHKSWEILEQGVKYSPEWTPTDEYFENTEYFFNGCFLIEFLVRIYLDRCGYFFQALNLMDFTLVGFTTFQLYILRPLGKNLGQKVTVFRLIRLTRFVRALKFMKLKMFTDLRVLMVTCISSLNSLGWSMVLLFMIMFIMALLMVNLVKGAIQDDNLSHEFRHWLFLHYGSTHRATYTMFEITMSGGWPSYFRRMVDEVSPGYAFLAVFYITLVVFAVIRIISAIFLKQTLKVASDDADMQAAEARAKSEENARKLQKVFKSLDQEGTGVVTEEEFVAVTSHPDVVSLLNSFELAVHDVKGLFDLMSDGNGNITYDDFIRGVMRLKGQARSLDVVAVCRNTEKIMAQLDKIARSVADSGDCADTDNEPVLQTEV